ncbi:hypothetical protein CYY_009015 [Polysphondylium violaceum]|uniref:Fe2OG dioxygenase domain-containing protein n=1 Tax=Polysphondylium violaceum TaxID=133409 RepID=A0A8J4PMG8_9MYCE|nr:hypothetical protein CYY_009015 [Polysphondylium violaceum]
MDTIFKNNEKEEPNKKELIDGLQIVENIISKEREKELVQEILKHEWDTRLSRRTQHYGYIYNYKSRNLNVDSNENKAEPLPDWAISLCQDLIDIGYINEIPQQMIINEYKGQQGISAHVDSKVFGETIFSVSLNAPCNMIFKKKSTTTSRSKTSTATTTSKQEPPQVVSFQVKPRTLLIMRGESRNDWTHEIPKLKITSDTRYSCTFRYLKLQQ